MVTDGQQPIPQCPKVRKQSPPSRPRTLRTAQGSVWGRPPGRASSEWGGGGGGGVWDPKVCVPKLAQPDFPTSKFRSFPRSSLWSGGGGGGSPAGDVKLFPRRPAHWATPRCVTHVCALREREANAKGLVLFVGRPPVPNDGAVRHTPDGDEGFSKWQVTAGGRTTKLRRPLFWPTVAVSPSGRSCRPQHSGSRRQSTSLPPPPPPCPPPPPARNPPKKCGDKTSCCSDEGRFCFWGPDQR